MMSPTVREASLPASSVKDQTTALFLEGAAESVDPKGESHLAQAPQRKLLAPTHDDVVMQSQAEILAALLDFFRHGDIRLGWRWITGGVVVDHDQGARVKHQRPLDDLARIDWNMVHGSDRKLLVRDDAIASVEVEDVEALHLAAHGHRTVVANSLPIAEDWVLVQIAPEDFAGLEDDGFFLRGHGGSPKNENADAPALSKGGLSAQL